MILDINMLPEALFPRVKTGKVKFHEENGTFVLTPIEEQKSFDNLAGMFSDGKLSIDNYLKQKQMDKGFEN